MILLFYIIRRLQFLNISFFFLTRYYINHFNIMLNNLF